MLEERPRLGRSPTLQGAFFARLGAGRRSMVAGLIVSSFFFLLGLQRDLLEALEMRHGLPDKGCQALPTQAAGNGPQLLQKDGGCPPHRCEGRVGGFFPFAPGFLGLKTLDRPDTRRWSGPGAAASWLRPRRRTSGRIG